MPDPAALTVPKELLVLGAAVRTGIIDALREGAMDGGTLAQKLSLDPRAVWIVCEALVALGYLGMLEDRYFLPAEVREMIYDPDSPDYTGLSFMHAYSQTARWLGLPEVIKTGRPAPRDSSPEHQKTYICAMNRHSGKSAAQVASHCIKGLKAVKHVLDIGGGPLAHAWAFSALGLKVTVLDMPEVVKMMLPRLTGQNAINMVAKDFREGLPEGNFDLAFLGNICHIYGEKVNTGLIRQVYNCLNPGGRIAILDLVRGKNPSASVFAVNMLVSAAQGGTWTYEQYAGWLESSGFAGARYSRVADREVVLAEKF